MKELVFVPTIGFRPAGTRTLREPAQTTANGTRLMVLAIAAAPDGTDVVIVHLNMAPLEQGLAAKRAARDQYARTKWTRFNGPGSVSHAERSRRSRS